MKNRNQYAIIEAPLKGHEALYFLESVARTCYQSNNSCTGEGTQKFIRNLISRGHESILEHVTATARICTNRAIANELVRHRIASFAQESTRYVSYKKKEGIEVVCLAREHYVYDDNDPGDGLTAMQMERREELFRQIEELYCLEIDEGIKPETARDILPLCLKTKIIITANLREWRHILKLRTDKAAHPQMRRLMGEILEGMKDHFPVIFDDIRPGVLDGTTEKQE